ncbi:MAG: hypothetical protein SFU25_11165, partial [Candidatus Caenarcaniphilales bacterium]|nr:hypothetical protein [Candidatus Caenarcaniphilales bacterium]
TEEEKTKLKDGLQIIKDASAAAREITKDGNNFKTGDPAAVTPDVILKNRSYEQAQKQNDAKYKKVFDYSTRLIVSSGLVTALGGDEAKINKVKETFKGFVADAANQEAIQNNIFGTTTQKYLTNKEGFGGPGPILNGDISFKALNNLALIANTEKAQEADITNRAKAWIATYSNQTDGLTNRSPEDIQKFALSFLIDWSDDANLTALKELDSGSDATAPTDGAENMTLGQRLFSAIGDKAVTFVDGTPPKIKIGDKEFEIAKPAWDTDSSQVSRQILTELFTETE